MIPPCNDCITLPICMSRFKEHYDGLKLIYTEHTLRLFYAVCDLKDRCKLLQDYLYRDPEHYHVNISEATFFYHYRLRLKPKEMKKKDVDPIIIRFKKLAENYDLPKDEYREIHCLQQVKL